MNKLIMELSKSTENAICRNKRRLPNMKYPAVVLVILLCTAVFFAGFKELPWGDCGPAELSKRVPLGVFFASKLSLLPRWGIIGSLFNGGVINCDDIKNINFGPAYLKLYFNLGSSSSSEDFLTTNNKLYQISVYCNNECTNRLEVAKIFNIFWWGVALYDVCEPLGTLEDYLGSDFTDCTRGFLEDIRFPGYAYCAVVTDKQGITRFYPLFPDYPAWGNTQGKKVGEFSLTKEELFEWFLNNMPQGSMKDMKVGEFFSTKDELTWGHKIGLDLLQATTNLQ